MSNIFERALTQLTLSRNLQTKQVGSIPEYINTRHSNAIKGTSQFDEKNAHLTSTVFACVNIIASSIAKLELNVYRDTEKGREIYKDHPWQKALRYSPDGRLSTSKWLNYAVTNILLTGGAPSLVQEYDKSLKDDRKLIPLPSEIENVAEYEGKIYYKFKGLEKWIPLEQLYLPMYFSKDSFIPVSPISAIRHELDIQHGAEETVKNFYQKGLFTLLFAESDLDSIGQADKKKIQDWFSKLEAQVAGSANAFDNAGITLIPPAFKVKSIPLPDLKFLENSKFTEGRIASIYNVPAWMLNFEGQNFSVGQIELSQLNFLNVCLSPVCNMIVQELNAKLLTIEERQQGITVDFSYDNLFALDRKTTAEYLKQLASTGAVSPNEIRAKVGLKTVDNEFMNSHFIQSQNQIIEKYDQWPKVKPVDTNSEQ